MKLAKVVREYHLALTVIPVELAFCSLCILDQTVSRMIRLNANWVSQPYETLQLMAILYILSLLELAILVSSIQALTIYYRYVILPHTTKNCLVNAALGLGLIVLTFPLVEMSLAQMITISTAHVTVMMSGTVGLYLVVGCLHMPYVYRIPVPRRHKIDTAETAI